MKSTFNFESYQMISTVWRSYLERVIPIRSINKLLVYTDNNREWIANPLVDLAIDLGWKVSMAFTDDFEEEDLNDISISLISFSTNTLIIAIISSTNPNLKKLDTIFPYNGMLLGFAGISIVFSPELLDSYILDFLRCDSKTVNNRLEKMLARGLKNRTMHIESRRGSNFQFISNGVSESPHIIFDDEINSLAFPGMEVKIDVIPGSFIGEIVVYGLILPVYDPENNLIDHYGIVSDDARFTISIQNGVINDITMLEGCKDDFVYKRFKQVLEEFSEKRLDFQVSFGIGHDIHNPPGVGIVDRNMHKSMSIKINDQVTIILYEVDLN